MIEKKMKKFKKKFKKYNNIIVKPSFGNVPLRPKTINFNSISYNNFEKNNDQILFLVFFFLEKIKVYFF